MEASVQVPEAILKLVEKYEFHQAAYKRGQFNETQLRREFIDPFFRALGWDVDNSQGNSEQYKEVIHEDPIRIRGSTEFIDYAFRIGGSRKFIVEAKKPAVNIKDDAGPALQIRRYAWNARLTLSILTDFEEFAVYDCTKKPMPGDNAATARIAYFTFKEYPEKWGWIESIFSQRSILRGSFDKFVEGTKGKKGTATVDEAILAEIEEWRDLLAKNIALRNAALSVEELNVAVQKTIDRILFLRICEDRGIEEYGCLQKLLEGQDVYQRLLTQFHRADTRYNSGIFHFNEEAGWDEMPDTLTPGLVIDDVVLKKIIKRLYYPESPYEFSVISPVILGQVYEQFLGKVIRLTAGHQAKVEYKPEVKKAGGVYYTPQYIVDYIVLHTVGELVKDKTPREIGKLRVLDPACGSGSFLLGAFQFLLDWHLNWYIHNLVPVIAEKSATSPEVQALLPEPTAKSGKKRTSGDTSLPIYKSANGSASRTRSDWKLTIAERKRILLNNIYGVDIDTQAVEVTKLSLLLKVLEEESDENVSKQLKLFDERALPSLHQNIKCGNSLIGTDIYTEMPTILEDPEAARQINAFDWDREFPEIMQGGGFDAVIGNPPYVRIQRIEYIQSDYLYKKYSTPTSKTDISILFVEKALLLIKKSGLVGLICTSQWMSTDYGKNIRKLLSTGKIKEIINFGSLPVFQKANTYPAIFILSKDLIKEIQFKQIISSNQLNFTGIESERPKLISIKTISEGPWNFGDIKIELILDERSINWQNLMNFGQAYIGVLTGMDEAFVVDKHVISENNLETEIIFPYAYQGAEVFRYSEVIPTASVIYPYYETKSGTPSLIDEQELKDKFPNIYRYLLKFKHKLQKRLDSRKLYAQGNEWYRHLRPGSFNYIRPKKFIIKGIDKISKVGTLDGNSAFNGANCPGIIFNESMEYSPFYFLAILNSKLATYHLRMVCPPKLSGYCRFNSTNINHLPLRTINFSDSTDKARHDKMVALVERMLALHKQKADVKIDHEKKLAERQIEATDKQLDTLVYELYGLTAEEIRIVENAG